MSLMFLVAMLGKKVRKAKTEYEDNSFVSALMSVWNIITPVTLSIEEETTSTVKATINLWEIL